MKEEKLTESGRPCTVGLGARIRDLNAKGKTDEQINEICRKEFGTCSLGHVAKVLKAKAKKDSKPAKAPKTPKAKATPPAKASKAPKAPPVKRAKEQIAEGKAKLKPTGFPPPPPAPAAPSATPPPPVSAS